MGIDMKGSFETQRNRALEPRDTRMEIPLSVSFEKAVRTGQENITGQQEATIKANFQTA